MKKKSNAFLIRIIVVVSILIPLVVALLFTKSESIFSISKGSFVDIHFFPKFHATLNSLTAICLAMSLYFIKKKNIAIHSIYNWVAFVLSSVFLVSYVIYHSAAPSIKFGDLDANGVLSLEEKSIAGSLRYVYYFILVTHIILSVIIIPLVLYTLLAIYRISKERHRKIAKITWPIWMYVALTGVTVYLLMKPYYAIYFSV